GVDFTGEEQTVRVNPDQYTIAPAGVPPEQPLDYNAGSGIGGVARAEKTVMLQAAVRKDVVATTDKTTGTVVKVVTTGAEQNVETVGKIVAQAGETIEKT